MSRLLLGLLAAAAGAGAVVALAATGGLTGPLAVVLVIVALLAVPVSRELPRRALITGAIVLGWWPVTWWWAWGDGLSRTAVGLAVLVGGLAAWVGSGTDRRARARRLVPRLRAADLVLAGVAAVAVALRLPWLRVDSGEAALSMLLTGWDHSAHFDITRVQRLHQVVVGQIPTAPHGDTWSYGSYPQSGHSLVASVMELLAGPAHPDPGVEVVTYVRAVGLLDVLLVVLVAAAVCSLPALRRRPWAAAPASALLVAALVLGPGGLVLHDGFPPFAVTLALLAMLPFLVVPAPRVVDPVRLAAVGGVLVGLAHGWTLVLVLAAPMVLVLLLPLERRRWRARPAAWAAAVSVVLATAAAGVWALAMLGGGVGLGDMLAIAGGISQPSGRVTLMIGLAAGLGPLIVAVLLWRTRRTGWSARATRVRSVALIGVPVAAAATAGWIAVVQLRGAGLSYYFWKFAIAADVAMAAVVVAAAVALLPRWRATRWRPLVALGLILAVLEAFGGTGLGPGLQAPGLRARAASVALSAAPMTGTTDLLAAAASTTAPEARRVTLVGAPDLQPIMASQWANALSGRWTDQSNELLRQLPPMVADPAVMAAIAPGLLADPATILLVPPQFLAEVRAAVDPRYADRVLAW